MKKSMLKLITIALAGSALATGVLAQTPATFPSKLVKLVVPFTPNSGSDIIARIIGPKLSARWGQPVVVENKPGVSGNLGAQAVANATPDGHTLLMAINTFTMTPAIYKSPGFNPVSDFAPITQLAEAGFAFVVSPDVPAKDMKSLIDLAKKNGGKLNYASPGNGTPHHLAMELFKSGRQLDIFHVPYKGIQGALSDLMGGRVQMMFATVHSTRPLEQGGRVRFLAVTGDKRNPLAPDVPTFKEQGIQDMEGVDAWFAVLAPAGTPSDIVARLNRDFVEVMNSAELKAELAQQGLTVKTSTPEQLSNTIKSDLARWKKVVVDAGITAD
ncbi:Bug family tripartite tricarboxylate transporter substrate binding protein [Hydrogenophaga sp.]|uniref:Bug family tripartite tricarboxylate transporter substrate binding protein n=1 Tax=Hydrogenophaga sp. TaxID=1904254 RepID=UPI00356397FA